MDGVSSLSGKASKMKGQVCQILGWVLLGVMCMGLGMSSTINHEEGNAHGAWKSAFPRTRMPSILEKRLPTLQGADGAKFLDEVKRGLLSPKSCKKAKVMCGVDTELISVVNSRHTGRGPGSQLNEYIHEKQLFKGSEIVLPDFHDNNFVASFLPDFIAKHVPYGTKESTNLMRMFQYSLGTNMSKNILMSLHECEASAPNDQKWVCARSMSMLVDFVSSNLGPNAELITSDDTTFSQKTVQIVDATLKYAGKAPPVSCHDFAFPHALFYCHYIEGTKIYKVTLQDKSSGLTRDRIAICHALSSITTTSMPGMSPNEQDCHWIYGSHLLWVPSSY